MPGRPRTSVSTQVCLVRTEEDDEAAAAGPLAEATQPATGADSARILAALALASPNAASPGRTPYSPRSPPSDRGICEPLSSGISCQSRLPLSAPPAEAEERTASRAAA